VSQVPVEGRDTHLREGERERDKKRKKERQRDPLTRVFFIQKTTLSPKKIP
jgi:hypothetical protein